MLVQAGVAVDEAVKQCEHMLRKHPLTSTHAHTYSRPRGLCEGESGGEDMAGVRADLPPLALPLPAPARPSLIAETAAYGSILVLPTVSYLVKGGASYQMIIRATSDCAHVDAQSRPRTPHSRARVRVLLTALS